MRNRKDIPESARHARLAPTVLAALLLSAGCGLFSGDPDGDASEDGEGGSFPIGGSTPGGSGGASAMGGSALGGGAGVSGRAGSGTMAGSGGSSLTGCRGIELGASGVLDLDLAAIAVSGRVTLAGEPLPAESGSRGSLAFTASGGQTIAELDLGTTGALTYALRLPPGTYDVSYVANSELCTPEALSSMPCSSGIVLARVNLDADGILDLDIPVVSVSGTVTLRAGPFPEVANRGSIAFMSAADGSAGVVPLAETGTAAYRLNLLPGTYDVSYQGDAGACTGDQPPAVPCNGGFLRRSAALTASGVLDLDVPAVRVTGALTVNGAAPADASAGRGALVFVEESGGAAWAKNFAASGPAVYEALLVPGVYDVTFVPGMDLCALPETPELPCVGGTLVDARELRSDGVLDIDLRAVTASGAVTLNGGALLAASADRGALVFTNTAAGSGATRSLGTNEPGAYSMRLLAGTYDVDYAPNPVLCATDSGPGIPCTGGSLVVDTLLETDGVLDVDLKSVQVSGTLSVNGAGMPDAAGDRGSLSFTLDGGTSVPTRSFATSGAATYALSLWPGTYRVAYGANAELCGAGLLAPPVPCVGGELGRSASLVTSGVLDLDVRTVVVSGSVRLNGAPLPAAASDRGEIAFTRAVDEGSSSAALGLGNDAAASYQITLSAGRYVVSHAANAALCPGPPPAPEVPCASQVVFGCEP